MAPTISISADEIDDLNYSARAGDNEELRELLTTIATREGVTVAEVLTVAKDESKATCLHKAAGNGLLETAKILVGFFESRSKEEKQAFLDAANEYGNTGLHWAALGGYLDMIKFLVAEGASPALANDRNYVPLDLAGLNEKTEVVDYFLASVRGKENENDDGLAEAAKSVEINGKDEQAQEPEQEKADSSSQATTTS